MLRIQKHLPQFTLTIALAVFLLCKVQVLHLPYFWDELGVYARAALYLHDHGLGLLPVSLPPELSRGHPILFSFLFGLSYTLFGDGILTGHLTALFVAILFVGVVFHVMKRQTGNTYLALAVSVCVLVQPLFVAQSVLVLPEVMLAMLMILALHAYASGNILLYMLVSSLAILVKETAIIIPSTVFFSQAILMLANPNQAKEKISVIHFFAFFPLLVYGAFLIIQKQQNGWFFFPYHIEAVSFHASTFIAQFADYNKFIFMEQGRLLLTAFILLAHSTKLIFYRKHIAKRNFHIMSALFAFAAGLCLYNDYDLYFLLSFIVFLVMQCILYFMTNHLHRFVVFMIVFAVTGLVFSAVNFYMNRYVLFIIPVYAVLLCTVLEIHKWRYRHVLVLCIAVCAVAMPNMYNNSFHYDEDMSYTDYVLLQKEAMQYAESMLKPGDKIFGNFPSSNAFDDKRIGYLSYDLKHWVHVRDKKLIDVDFILLCDPGSYDTVLPDGDSLKVVHTFRNNIAAFTLYEKN